MLLVITRPRNLPIAVAAVLGAAASLLLGLVSLRDVVHVLGLTWNATLALVGLMLLSATLDANGAFRAAAHAIARRARGDGRRLFVGLALLTAGAATLLANDGAILILTPIVAELAAALAFTEAAGGRLPVRRRLSVRRAVDAVAHVEPDQHPHGRHARPQRRRLLRAHALADADACSSSAPAPCGSISGAICRAASTPRALGAPPPFSRGSWRATWTALGVLFLGYAAATVVRLPLGVIVLVVGAGLLAWETWRDAVDARALLRAAAVEHRRVRGGAVHRRVRPGATPAPRARSPSSSIPAAARSCRRW